MWIKFCKTVSVLVTDKVYHIMLYRVHGFDLTTLMVIGIDCIGSFQTPYDHDHDGPSSNLIYTNVSFKL